MNAAEILNSGDRFCRTNQIRLLSAEDGKAAAELVITEQSLNAGGMVQGGAIYTLADFAFAGAANSKKHPCPTLNGCISYLRPGMGSKLLAEAVLAHCGKRTCCGEVNVYDDQHRLVAKAQFTGFFQTEA